MSEPKQSITDKVMTSPIPKTGFYTYPDVDDYGYEMESFCYIDSKERTISCCGVSSSLSLADSDGPLFKPNRGLMGRPFRITEKGEKLYIGVGPVLTELPVMKKYDGPVVG